MKLGELTKLKRSHEHGGHGWKQIIFLVQYLCLSSHNNGGKTSVMACTKPKKGSKCPIHNEFPNTFSTVHYQIVLCARFYTLHLEHLQLITMLLEFSQYNHF